MLIWIDLETTGLDPTRDKILEIAVVITDDRLGDIARYQRVTNEAALIPMANLDPAVRDMHMASGLWAESLAVAGNLTHRRSHVELEVYQFITQHVYPEAAGRPVSANGRKLLIDELGPESKVIPLAELAGSTVAFDRAFLEVHMPLVARLLHYRSLDVTALDEFARRACPKVFEGRPRTAGANKHRAMPDILESLAKAQHYARAFASGQEVA